MVGVNRFIPIPGIQNTPGFGGIISFALYEKKYRISIMFCTINPALSFFFGELPCELCVKFGW